MNNNTQELLDEIELLEKSENGLNLKTIILGLSLLIIVTILSVPKIYLASAIYYTSVQTNVALDNFRSLKEENAHLIKKLEFLKYKTDINASLNRIQ